MNGASVLQRLELYSTHDFQAEGYYCSFEVLVCNTSVSELSTTFQENYGGNAPFSVLSKDTLFINWKASTPGWNGFDFDSLFSYNGTGNLIIEFRYMYSSGTTVNTRAMSLPAANRCLDAGYPNSTTGDLMSFLTNMRIHYSPTGISDDMAEPSVPSLSVGVNPAYGLVPVNIEMPVSGSVDLAVISINGSLIRSVHLGFLNQGIHFHEIDLSELPAGIYLLSSTMESGRSSVRFALIK